MTGPRREQLLSGPTGKGRGRRRPEAASPLRRFAAALVLGLIAAQAPLPPAVAGSGKGPNGGAEAPFGRVIVIDQERLFNESRYGQAILAEIRTLSQELAAENRRIEKELEAEEKALAERRRQMEPGEFRVLAEAFNTKVEKIRKEQAAKEQAILGRLNERRLRFFSEVGRLVIRLTEETGARIVLDKRMTIYAAPAADMTDRLIALVDRDLTPPQGEGGINPSPSPAPAAPSAAPIGGFSLGTPLSDTPGTENPAPLPQGGQPAPAPAGN